MINAPAFWISFNICIFLAVYLYGRKWHPWLSLVLAFTSCVGMILLAYLDPSWILASLIIALIYLRILRMPDQQPGFHKLFQEYKIRPTSHALPALLSILGERKWSKSESSFTTSSGQNIPYYFWQGHTKYFVSSGEYVRRTTYTHYIAFIFPPDTVSDHFKQKVISAADQSQLSWIKRLQFKFWPDTETPSLVTTASDGTFIILYHTLQESACYEQRFAWLKNELTLPAYPIMGSFPPDTANGAPTLDSKK